MTTVIITQFINISHKPQNILRTNYSQPFKQASYQTPACYGTICRMIGRFLWRKARNIAQLANRFLVFMEPESLQEPLLGPCPEAIETCPHLTISGKAE